jgi:hypothetical protein
VFSPDEEFQYTKPGLSGFTGERHLRGILEVPLATPKTWQPMIGKTMVKMMKKRHRYHPGNTVLSFWGARIFSIPSGLKTIPQGWQVAQVLTKLTTHT